jgi:hypothetical protein
MPNERIDIAVEAAAKALHEQSRNKRQFTWEASSVEWRADMRNFVRPLVEAAIEASDEYMALALRKRIIPTDNR